MSKKKNASYNRRTTADKAQFTHEILNVIGTGTSGAKSMASIAQYESVQAFKKPINPADIANYRSKINAESEEAFNHELQRIRDENFLKEITRIIREQLSKSEFGFTRLKHEGLYHYYWESYQAKEDALAQFEMSEPRALAFHFIQKHLHLIIPPHIYQSLSFDFDKAAQRLQSSNLKGLLNKIDFNPLGYDSISQLDKGEFNKSELTKWRDIFSFTFAEKTFDAQYESIHRDYAGITLTLSPQKIVLLNQQMMVLAYEHNNQAMKFFEIERLFNVKEGLLNFIKKQEIDYKTKHTVKAICHTWVKNYAESVFMGENQSANKTEQKDCWKLEADVWFPNHFNDNSECIRPDPFFFANYLGIFGDALAIVEPAFLKNELARRASKLHQYHSGQLSPYEVVVNSPREMTDASDK